MKVVYQARNADRVIESDERRSSSTWGVYDPFSPRSQGLVESRGPGIS